MCQASVKVDFTFLGLSCAVLGQLFLYMINKTLYILIYSLEFWYYTTLLVLVGLLKHGKLQIDIMSVW